MEDNQNIEKVRVDMGGYCAVQCNSKCCRRSKLVIFNRERLKGIVGKNSKCVQEEDNYFTIDLSKGCPSLGSDFKCKVYNTWNRPKMCHEYPIFEKGKLVLISSDCDFYREGLFTETIERLRIDGFRVEIV